VSCICLIFIVDNHFLGPWIGRGGPIEILRQVLILFLPFCVCVFGYVKEEVCHSKPETFELEQQILDTFATVPLDFLRNLCQVSCLPGCRCVCKMLGPVFESDIGWLEWALKW
jgi:hypothetical protein